MIRGVIVGLDTLVFGSEERGPGEDLRLQFKAVQTMSDEDKKVIASLNDAYIEKIRLEEFAVR